MVVKSSLIDILSDTLSLKNTFTLPTYKENQLNLTYELADKIITQYGEKEPVLPFAATNVFDAVLKDYRRLSAVNDGCKSVYEVTFDTTGSDFTFKPGDTIGIIPRNRNEEVDAIIDHLKLTAQADLQYTILPQGVKIPPHIPAKSSVRHALTYCCDVRIVLKKLFLLALSMHTKDEKERNILQYLCSKEGSAAYNTHILNKHFSILDLFCVFKSCQPPIEVLLAHLPRLLPRPYSVVNSSLVNPNIVKICFSVNKLSSNRKGLVTGWLESMINEKSNLEEKLRVLNITYDGSTHDRVPIYIRKNMSGFSTPANLEIPLIFIGPGTGVAPFIGFLEERQHLKSKHPQKTFGEVWMFFGCRDPHLDFLYENELNMFLKEGVISKLITSFSRVENNFGNKYVQDGLMQNGDGIVKLINNGAAIFVCGDKKNMTVQVKETLVKCIVEHSNKSVQDAENLLSDMQTGKRYLVDAWC